MTEYIKSPLNYTGGKFKLLPQIIPLLPKNISKFIDLFGGGCNVGINVKANEIIYNDLDVHVVQMLEYFNKHSTEEMLTEIHNTIENYHLSKDNQDGFLNLRTDYNLKTANSPLTLYTIICYAFNNQIRFNSKNEYNMPFGKNRSSFNPALEQKFVSFCNRLHDMNIKFINSDFRELHNVKDAFFYCDPPYFNSTATYNEKNGWAENDEKDLRNMLVDLHKQNTKWALSNNLLTNPTLKDFANEYEFSIYYINGSYGNCNYHKKDKSDKDCEVVITNY